MSDTRLNLHHIELFITTCTTQILGPFTVNRSTVLATLHKFKKKVCLPNHVVSPRQTLLEKSLVTLAVFRVLVSEC